MAKVHQFENTKYRRKLYFIGGANTMETPLLAPFPYFGGKRKVTAQVWKRFGTDIQHYIEPFCGSAAMLLSAPKPASLEVVSDVNGFLANFWRATKHQPDEVAFHADYPVSHIDLGSRHLWLAEQRERLQESLKDPEWIGDAKVAGWWLWGQCAWIGHEWCEWSRVSEPHNGKVPHIGNAGRGIQALGQTALDDATDEEFLTSGGRTAKRLLRVLSNRLERVRILHGDWSRCLNHNYGKKRTAVFLDPPYKKYTLFYRCADIASDVETWAKNNAELRIALCGHVGDYDLPGWDQVEWNRGISHGSSKTVDQERIWYSPACKAVSEPEPDSDTDDADCFFN